MKRVAMFLHGDRIEAVDVGRTLATLLDRAGVEVGASAADAARLAHDAVGVVEPLGEGIDLMMVLGGDGTLLRAAQVAYPAGVPLLGVNIGRLGFLSSLEPDDAEAGLAQLIERGFSVEERMVLEGTVVDGGQTPVMALNDVIVAKTDIGRAIKLRLEIAGTHLVSFAADGLIVATSTGATAYSFSAGGPVVSPALDCIVVTPVAPHGLFDRSIVVPPHETVVVRVLPDPDAASLSVDGGPPTPLAPGATLQVAQGRGRIRLARVHQPPFWELFRTKFGLPSSPREDG